MEASNQKIEAWESVWEVQQKTQSVGNSSTLQAVHQVVRESQCALLFWRQEEFHAELKLKEEPSALTSMNTWVGWNNPLGTEPYAKDQFVLKMPRTTKLLICAVTSKHDCSSGTLQDFPSHLQLLLPQRTFQKRSLFRILEQHSRGLAEGRREPHDLSAHGSNVDAPLWTLCCDGRVQART